MTQSTHRPPAPTPAAQHPPAHTPTAQTVGVFTIEYTLFTNATPGHAIQFGMDFSLTSTSTVKKPLSQLIFPAVAVGTNRPGMWNIDNHHSGNDPASLIFANAEHGTITDKPREIVAPHQGVKTTKFAVYLVDPKKEQSNQPVSSLATASTRVTRLLGPLSPVSPHQT